MANIFDLDNGLIEINTVSTDMSSTGDALNGGTDYYTSPLCGKLVITKPQSSGTISLQGVNIQSTLWDLSANATNKWKCNDNLGDYVVVDSIGTSTGAVTGAARQFTSVLHSTGKLWGGSFNLTGTNQYVETNYSSLLTDFTFITWFTIVGGGNYGVIGCDKDDNSGFCIWGNTSALYCNVFQGGSGNLTVPYTGGLTLGAWNFGMISVSSTLGALTMINGNVVGTEPTLTAIADSGRTIKLGTNGATGDKLVGKINDATIFNKALTATEGLYLYNSGLGTENLTGTYYYNNAPVYGTWTCDNSSPQKEVNLSYLDKGLSIPVLSSGMEARIKLYHDDLWRRRK